MVDVKLSSRAFGLATETVQSAALALESVDNIEGGDSLALGVLVYVSDDNLGCWWLHTSV
jgi:hypothetical protein